MSILRWTYDTTDAIQTCLNKEVWWALSLVSTGMRSLQFYKLDFVERYTARSIGMKKPGCAPFPWGEHRRTLGPIQLGGDYPLLYKECGCKLKHLAVRVVRCCRCWYSVLHWVALCFGTVNSRCIESSIATRYQMRFYWLLHSDLLLQYWCDFQYGGEVGARYAFIIVLLYFGFASLGILSSILILLEHLWSTVLVLLFGQRNCIGGQFTLNINGLSITDTTALMSRESYGVCLVGFLSKNEPEALVSSIYVILVPTYDLGYFEKEMYRSNWICSIFAWILKLFSATDTTAAVLGLK